MQFCVLAVRRPVYAHHGWQLHTTQHAVAFNTNSCSCAATKHPHVCLAPTGFFTCAGYGIGHMPSAYLGMKYGIRVWLAIITMSWGVVAMFGTMVSSANGLYWQRAALGLTGVLECFWQLWFCVTQCGRVEAMQGGGALVARARHTRLIAHETQSWCQACPGSLRQTAVCC